MTHEITLWLIIIVTLEQTTDPVKILAIRIYYISLIII